MHCQLNQSLISVLLVFLSAFSLPSKSFVVIRLPRKSPYTSLTTTKTGFIDMNDETNDQNNIHFIIEGVSAKSDEWATLPLSQKVDLLENVISNAFDYKDEWLLQNQQSKGVDPQNDLHGYGELDILVQGPATFGGYAHAILASLKYCLQNQGKPPPPTNTKRIGKQKRLASVWPSKWNLLEHIEAFGMTGELVCSITSGEEVQDKYDEATSTDSGVAVILAPGNFDAPTDLLCQLFIKGRVCVYKPHPINKSSVNVLEKILHPLVQRGYIAIVDDSKETAQQLTASPLIKEIVLTGSSSTLEKIQATTSTPVCAELGAVNPWLVVPGPQWNERSVDKHARALVFAKLGNNGHVCVSPQVLVLPKAWKYRKRLLQRVEYWMSQHPGSPGYYPESAKSHTWFAEHPKAKKIQFVAGRKHQHHNSDKIVPVYPNQQRPILITGISQEKDRNLLQREAWCPVLMELSLEFSGGDPDEYPMDYLKEAIKITEANVFGSLSMAILINDRTMRRHRKEFDDILVNHTPYGIVGVNIWPVLANSMAQLRWGAFSGKVESGAGSLGNSFLFRNCEKTIIRAPFSYLPRHMLQVMPPKKAKLVFNRLATYKLKPNMWTQTCLFAALFLGV
jgi:acyl-CoA reductase-like NAD-dependent aldehyde dehydrogenase